MGGPRRGIDPAVRIGPDPADDAFAALAANDHQVDVLSRLAVLRGLVGPAFHEARTPQGEGGRQDKYPRLARSLGESHDFPCPVLEVGGFPHPVRIRGEDIILNDVGAPCDRVEHQIDLLVPALRPAEAEPHGVASRIQCGPGPLDGSVVDGDEVDAIDPVSAAGVGRRIDLGAAGRRRIVGGRGASGKSRHGASGQKGELLPEPDGSSGAAEAFK